MRLYDKNMIEMRDGRKPVISPQLKSVSNYIDVSLDDIIEACEAAFKNHSKKNDVVNFNSDFDGNSLKLYEWYLDARYSKFYFKMRTYLWQRCYSPYYRCRDRKQMRIRF